ncbi:hypothetical protein KFL_000010560 [Klebsormidium nitens]|uniref:Uncharacterized protein n=1 Tax=Klebsormidium nitens TaxID=105231 RepID=A0A0U9HPQ0_KLENI|nr:hypothetical protein KFL_000010560 [Klebsormidium nitens]|eukprot:GAQ77607.1 hypothetical protein KFL_000010560 [Klebsormidium nitens]
MAFEVCSQASLVRECSFGRTLALGSQDGRNARHMLEGAASLFAVRIGGAQTQIRPGLFVLAAAGPGDGKGTEKASAADWPRKIQPRYWKDMPEPREFCEGKGFTTPGSAQRLDKRTVVKKKLAKYAQFIGGGKSITTDPKLVRMLNYRLTSGEHKGKMLREVSKKYLEWLATSAAPIKPLQKGELNKVVLRSKEETLDVGEMAAIVLQLPEIKNNVRQVDVDDMQEAAMQGKGKGAESGQDVYRTALFKLKSMDIQLELDKKEKEEKKEAARWAVKAGVIKDPSEARRARRRVKQWDEAEEQKKSSLAKTFEERRLQETELEAEEALKSSYGVAASQRSDRALPPGQLLEFKGRGEMLGVAQQALMKAKLHSSKPKDADLDPGRLFEESQPSAKPTARRGRPKRDTGGSSSGVDWRTVSKKP